MKRRTYAVRAKARRLLLIAPLAVALLYATAAVSFATIAHASAPLKVLAIYPAHGPSLSDAAALTIAGDEANSKETSRQLAQQAIRRSPVSPGALRTLALLSDMKGNRADSAQLLTAALKLNRRDLSVTLLLIDEHIRRGDLPGALRLYDIGLRTSRQAPTVLLPNLVDAGRARDFLPLLAQTLAAGPDWGDEFSKQLVESEIPPENKVELARRLRGKRWFGAPFQTELVTRLTEDGHFALAADVIGKPRGYDRGLARAFDLPVGENAFGWKLANNYYVETRLDEGSSGKSLVVRMSPDFRDRPARILLLLPSGVYRLSSRLQALSPAKSSARWKVECAANDGRQIASLPLTASGSQTTFVVTSGCEGQWLALNIDNKSSSAEDVHAVVSALSITPDRGF